MDINTMLFIKWSFIALTGIAFISYAVRKKLIGALNECEEDKYLTKRDLKKAITGWNFAFYVTTYLAIIDFAITIWDK